MFSLQIIFILSFLNISFASIFKNQGINDIQFQKDEATKQLKKNQQFSFFNTCTDTAGIKRKNGEEWVVSDYFVMLCHQISLNETSWPIMRIEVVACLREDKKTRIPIGSQVEEYPGHFLSCRKENPNDPTGIVHREWRLVPLPQSVEDSNTCLDSEGKRRQNGEEWVVGTYFVMLCHQVLFNQSSLLVMQVEVIACLREDLKTRIPVGSEVEETPGRFLVCKKIDPEPTGMVWREWRIAEPNKKPVETDKTCLDSEGKRRQNGEEWIVSDYFVFTCHQVVTQSLSIMQIEIIACLRDDKITRIPVGTEVEESPGKFFVCRKVDPNDPTIMVRREWRVSVVQPSKPVENIVKTCLDNDGKTRQDGEEWIVGDYFVFQCHQIPSNPVPIMIAQVVACLREDRQTRISVGEEIEESPGMILSCKKADSNDPNGVVSREWRVAESRVSTNSSSIKTPNSKIPTWCSDKKIGTQLINKNFVFECASSYALPKLVACLLPHFNNVRMMSDENIKLGSFKMICKQLNNGTMIYQYY